MSSPDELKMGIYRHYKGPLYQVLALAHDANADSLWDHYDSAPFVAHPAMGERIVVVYFPLQLDGAHLGSRMAVRTLDDFQAWVDPKTGDRVEVFYTTGRKLEFRRGASDWDYAVQRFNYVGPQWVSEEMTSG